MAVKTFGAPAALGLALIVVLTGLGLWAGGLYASRYEGDMLHLVEIILRVADGERPHRDFMTPLGLLSVWPISVFVSAGFGVGTAILLGQALVALALLPLTVWVASSRFEGWLRPAFVCLVTFFVLGVVHGGAEAQISLSMHYNRWAWALAFVAIPVALLPPLRRSVTLDAVTLGITLAALVLIKATYVVALVPGIVVLLAVRGMWSRLGFGVLAGSVILGLFTLWSGTAYWFAYVNDLLATATSELRAYPGLSIDQLLTGPLYVLGHIAALAAVILLRRAGRKDEGLGLLILLPGLIYITYQNFGNDPQWMFLLGLVLLQLVPSLEGSERAHRTGFALGVALMTLAAPLVVNIAYSPVRQALADKSDYVPMFPSSTRHDDFYTQSMRANQVNFQIAGDERVSSLRAFAEMAERADEPAVLNGETLERCEMHSGIIAWTETTARDLQNSGFGNARLLTTDLLNAVWMFGAGSVPLKGGAPWRYGGLPGIGDATHVLVPLCPIHTGARAGMLAAMDEADVELREVRRTDAYVLLEIADQPKAASAR